MNMFNSKMHHGCKMGEQFHIDFILSILVCLVSCFLPHSGFNIKCVDGNGVSSLRGARDPALGL